MNQELLQQIGQIFRQKRIKKNYSLEQISEITKISIKNLIYIEEGNFQKLPGKFYEKSFKLIFWYIIESLWNQNQNIYYFSILWCVDSFENMPDNL